MYNYTKGDVNAISSLSLASSVLGLALAVGILDGMQSDNNNTWPVLIPAVSAILATSIGQKQVRNVHLTKKQGSSLRLSTYGAGMVGLGLAAMLESESPAIYIGLPAGLALLTQQLIFNRFKTINLSHRAQASNEEPKSTRLTLNVQPENYFLNERRTEITDYFRGGEFNAPGSIVKLKMSF